MRPILEIQNISKAYKLHRQGGYLSLRDSLVQMLKFEGSKASKERFWALKEINLNVQRGESLGIIGRNGAGKSTLLKILSKITPPTKGQVRARGRVASLLEVGTGFHPELTGRENIFLNGSILGLKKLEIEQKFDEIVDFAGTEAFLDTPLKHYSSGMQLRLAFAVAAHLEPEILVIDEVLAVGDAAFQQKCLGKMNEVSQSGRTILFVSHNMGAIQRLCPRTVVLEQGKLIYEGPTPQAIDQYVRSTKENTQTISLHERKDRVAGGIRFRFTEVHFYVPEVKSPVLAITNGQEARIAIHYDCQNNLLGREVELSVAVYKVSGEFLFACRSDSINQVLTIKKNSGIFTCILPKNPLKEGIYHYNLIAFNKGEILDFVTEAGQFEVNAGDYYGTGKTSAKGRSGVCVPYQWE